MRNRWNGIAIVWLAVAFLAGCLPGISQRKATGTETAIWNLEHAYWNYVQANDLRDYRALWRKDFLGWPSVSAAPVPKDHITDWITAQTGKGLRFKTLAFRPAGIQVNGNVALTYYWLCYQWLDRDGHGATHTTRVTHTWLGDGTGWHIFGGMSMPEDAAAHN